MLVVSIRSIPWRHLCKPLSIHNIFSYIWHSHTYIRTNIRTHFVLTQEHNGKHRCRIKNVRYFSPIKILFALYPLVFLLSLFFICYFDTFIHSAYFLSTVIISLCLKRSKKSFFIRRHRNGWYEIEHRGSTPFKRILTRHG